MQQLSYETLKDLGATDYLLKDAPERVLQFGEGGFLRAFVDYFIDLANERTGFNTKVVVVQPIDRGLCDAINRQEGLYTLYLRGMEDGKRVDRRRVISCISRCIDPYREFAAFLECAKNPDLRYIASNTTEAGIAYDPACGFDDAPPASFPAKLTRLLYQRYRVFDGDRAKGIVVLSCELIDHNGRCLRECVDRYIEQWGLEDGFRAWLDESCLICSTLVDRIVTGYPAGEVGELNEQNGYRDDLLDLGEIFASWVIEGPPSLAEELPFAKAGLPVQVVADHLPYKQRKVRILNGAHTTMVPVAYLCGFDLVRDSIGDPRIRRLVETALHKEIIPVLTLPKEELNDFADAVFQRFANPFVDHRLLSIALNSASKWTARVLPSLREYSAKYGSLPPCLTFSFAALLAFYRGDSLDNRGMTAARDGQPYLIQDERRVLELFFAHRDDTPKDMVQTIASSADIWSEDLTALPGFADAVTGWLERIQRDGMTAAIDAVLEEVG